METPIATHANIHLPFLNLKFSQEVNRNTKIMPHVEVKKEVKYFLCISLVKSVVAALIQNCIHVNKC